ADAGIRVVHLRTGVVLGRGGALANMLPPFRLGLGGPIGSGRQWMSWISLHDVVRAIQFLIDAKDARGAVNVVSPEPVRNAEFAQTLGHVLRRPARLPVPAFVIKAALGQMAEEALLGGQRAVPRRLLDLGFTFERAGLARALEPILR